MRLAVLSSPESWYYRDLVRAAHGQHEIACVPFSSLQSSLALNPAARSKSALLQTSLSEFDAVLVRSMPPGSLEQVVFRMDVLQAAAGGRPVVNPPRALEAAIDKYLTSARLVEAGLDTPRTIVCQTSDDALAAFESLGRDVVVKPLFGGEGRGIARLTDPALAERAFGMLQSLGAVLYVQEFVNHFGYDLRLFVIGSQVLGMKRSNPNDWRTNVSRGAKTEPCELTSDLQETALRAARCVGAPLAGVDLLPARDGRMLVLEVNAVPGWRALARTLDIDMSARVLSFVESLR